MDETAGTITLSATGHTEIRWIAQGVQVATGATLNLVAHAVPVPGYVRAELHGPEGITYTNPFGVREFGIRRQNDKYLP